MTDIQFGLDETDGAHRVTAEGMIREQLRLRGDTPERYRWDENRSSGHAVEFYTGEKRRVVKFTDEQMDDIDDPAKRVSDAIAGQL